MIFKKKEKGLRVASIVESSDDAIAGLNMEGIITSWNASAERLYGYKAAEAVGRHVGFLVPPGREDEAPAFLDRLKAGGHIRHYETLRRAKDGRLVDVSLSMSPILDRGVVVGASIVTRDITEHRQTEEELKGKTEELARSNADLEMFASVASHDLQEPLRKIMVFGELLEKRAKAGLDEASLDYLHRMQTSATRMTKLIAGLLQLSRLGRDETPREPVDLNAVFSEIISDLDARIAQTSAQVDVPKDLPTLPGQPLQLKQLFQNLLSNALKFRNKTEPPRVSVRWRASPDKNMAEITVSDNGIGFDERFAEKIFQPFLRLHPLSEYEGTGIGLALCRKITARHQGSITARAAPGQGAVFTVRLPIG